MIALPSSRSGCWRRQADETLCGLDKPSVWFIKLLDDLTVLHVNDAVGLG